MARVVLTTQPIAEPSLNPVYTAGTDTGATYTVDGDADYVEVVNANAGTIVATVETGGTFGGHALADKAVSIPTGQRRKIPIRDRRSYPRPSGASPDPGKVYVNLDIVASVTAGAFRV